MNQLEYQRTLENGNKVLYFPCNGVIFYFEVYEWDKIRLHTVDTLKGVTTDCDEWSKLEDLPAPVRRAVVTSQYDMRSTKTTLVGAMSDG